VSSERDSFVHLHVHTEYSMLDGAARVTPLVTAAADMRMPAIAITDHGNTFGAYDFWQAATSAGVKPIIGTEAYLTPGTHRSDKSRVQWGSGGEDDVSGGGAYTHMTLLSSSTEGMHNLFKLSSLSSLEGFYFKPRMDRELLSRYASGLIATTGCPGGEIQTRLRLGQYDAAREAAAEFRDIFGAENFFVEIMDHGLDIERRVTADLLRLAADLSLPLVATNDLHYTHAHDADAHAALLCVQSASTLDDPKRFKFESNEFYLKSPAEMRHVFKDFPEACDNTLLIAERCESEFAHRDLMPRFPVPEGETEASWFAKEVEVGLARRFPDGVSEQHRAQAAYEVDVITNMGFPGYFLVVSDFIAWARQQGIRVGPGRGSAAGSLASYAMGITELDPLRYGLIFERFLNPDRVSLPDVDVDFDDRRRGEVIRYVTEKYGDDRVAQIVTFGTIKAKQALKDSARVLGMPYSVGERLTKAMPRSIMGKDITLSEIVDPTSERYKEANDFRALLDTDPEARTVFDTATGLENLKRQWGVHAAGVIMSAEPLMEIVPIMMRDDGAIITQFDQPPCEALGLLKMDFLGLRNLTVIEDALANIVNNRGETVTPETLDLDADQNTYDLLGRGDTLGVFQLDGGPMRALLRQLKPTNFEDISAVIALYRPGPMAMNSHTNYALRKNNLQVSEPIHPELEVPLQEILGGTFGLIVYQEQVMAVAQKVAGFTLGQADVLRRAMGKKKKSELDKLQAEFESGMAERGFGAAAQKTLWDTLLPFADYAFNKAHSAGYGVLSYWTAYLKANYAPEYMAALLTSVGDAKDKLGSYLSECRRMGVKVLPPDVNASEGMFAAVGGDIRFGLGAIRNVGANVVEAIKETRREKGAFTSFHDFIKKVPLQVANRKTVESLIKAGAFDGLGHTRRGLMEIHESAIDEAASLKRNEANGMVDLFGDLFDEESPEQRVPESREWTKRDLLAFEREMLGLYVSDHPLAGLEIELAKHATVTIDELITSESIVDGDTVTIAGLVTDIQRRVARNSGKPYAMVEIEDFTGQQTVMFLGKTYLDFGNDLATDVVVSIRGRVSARDEGKAITVQDMTIPDISRATVAGPLGIRVDERRATTGVVEKLQDILTRHPGDVEVRLTLVRPEATRLFELPQRVVVSSDLFGELKSLLGPGCLE
jgi:DNA polymerase-3 subunit alpha